MIAQFIILCCVASAMAAPAQPTQDLLYSLANPTPELLHQLQNINSAMTHSSPMTSSASTTEQIFSPANPELQSANLNIDLMGILNNLVMTIIRRILERLVNRNQAPAQPATPATPANGLGASNWMRMLGSNPMYQRMMLEMMSEMM